jgi:hypothetical protein
MCETTDSADGRQPDKHEMNDGGHSLLRLSAPAMRTFHAIADFWGVNEEQRLALLGYPTRLALAQQSMMVQEGEGVTLGTDVLMRISMILRIHLDLGVLFSNEHDGVGWLRRTHAAAVFANRAPLDLIVSGRADELMKVLRYLDGARQGIYMQPNQIDKGFAPYTDDELLSS